MRASRIATFSAVAAVLWMLCAGAAEAAPVWRIDSLSDTTAAPLSTYTYAVEARDMGDAATDGSTETLTADLPPGITAVQASVFRIGGGLSFPCSGANAGDPVLGSSRVVCTTSAPITPQTMVDRMTLTVAVDGAAAGLLMSRFTVDGGGAASAFTVDPIQIGPPPGFGIDAFDGQTTADAAGTAFTQAGGHPYAISTYIDFNTANDPRPLHGDYWPAEPPKDIYVDLPPGFVGAPTDIPQCTLQQLANSSGTTPEPLCPPASQIGSTVVRTVFGRRVINGPLPVFNLFAPPDVPARFGFNAFGSIVVLDAHVRTGGDYGVTIAVRDIPEGLALAGTSLTLWGVPADPSHNLERTCAGQAPPYLFGPTCTSSAPQTAFLRNPTSCPEPGVGLTTALRMDSWLHPGALRTASFTSHLPAAYPYPPSDWGSSQGPTGCASVPFDPSLTDTPATPAKAGSPDGFSFDLTLPQSNDANSIGESDLRTASVTLPEGVRVSPSSAHGLGACAPDQIGIGSEGAPKCPDSSRIGSVIIDTPLLSDPLTGSIYLATPNSIDQDSPLGIYVTATGPGTEIKLVGHVHADPVTGQITTTFDDNPQLPFSRLHLEFNGGPTAPLVLPNECNTYVSQSEFTGWSGKIVDTRSEFTVSGDGQGGPCAGPRFSPAFRAGTENPIAGTSNPLHVTVTRGDADQELGGIRVSMPNGLTGKIANVRLCGESDARAGTCPESSRVGSVTVGAGAGTNPFYITSGRAYLTGPYKQAPFGLSIVVPAVAGPFDLGNVNVRSSILVDRHTSDLSVVSDPLPTILQGIPLDVRDVRVNVDRQDFIVNPTSCAVKSIVGTFSSTAGMVAHASDRFQVGECANLRFNPSMAISVGGLGHTAGGASSPLTTVLRMPRGDANLRYVRVTLPTTINARLPVINRACTRAQFEASNCKRARAGTAVARTPLLKDPLRGNVYFVRNGHPLPDMFIALRGQVAFDLIGRVSIPSGTHLSTTFNAIPDVPITSFALRLVAGSQGPVGAARNLCSAAARNAKTAVDFIGQNGRVKQVDQRMVIHGCPKPRRQKAKRR